MSDPPDSKALATRETDDLVPAGTRDPDAYEAKYMKGQGMVLHRAKERAPKALQALMLLPAIGSLPSLAVGWAGIPIVLFSLVLSVVLWGLFSVLRVTVSEGQVNVQYGLFGPTIPISQIESAEATTYDWKKFGGWGIRRSLDGEWIYNMPGDKGRAVRIVWRDTKGNRKVTLVGSKTPQELAQAIAQARSKSLSGTPAQPALDEGDDVLQ